MAYNYRNFPMDMEVDVFKAWPAVLPIGSTAPDGEVTLLSDGSQRRLCEFWQQGPLVLEFGSLT